MRIRDPILIRQPKMKRKKQSFLIPRNRNYLYGALSKDESCKEQILEALQWEVSRLSTIVFNFMVSFNSNQIFTWLWNFVKEERYKGDSKHHPIFHCFR